MEKNITNVLAVCADKAKKGEMSVNVFDIMYETGLAYPELKVILDRLVREKGLAEKDIKTYLITGDADRLLDKYIASETTENPFAENFLYRTDEEDLQREALRLCIENGKASFAVLQRELNVGCVKACELINWMEDKGYVSHGTGLTPGRVLITPEQFEELYGGQPEEPDCDDNLSELDKKFAEYERWLRGENDKFFDDLTGDTKSGDLTDMFADLSSGEPLESMTPADTVIDADDDDEFLERCGRRMMEIIASDKSLGRKGAIKKVKALLAETDKSETALIEVYEGVLYELENMTDYYYAKFRKSCG